MTKQGKNVRAVKSLLKDKMSKDEHWDFMYEMSILKNLDHPNILKLYEVFEDS
jgi:calcium-dependent protein kinase